MSVQEDKSETAEDKAGHKATAEADGPATKQGLSPAWLWQEVRLRSKDLLGYGQRVRSGVPVEAGHNCSCILVPSGADSNYFVFFRVPVESIPSEIRMS